MVETIDQKLRLAACEVKRTVAAQAENPGQGIVKYKRPRPENATFTIVGTTDTVTVKLYIRDHKGRARYRIKIYWIDSRDGGQTLYCRAMGCWKYVGNRPLIERPVRVQVKAILKAAGIEVE